MKAADRADPPLLLAARALLSAGLCVVPANARKHPKVSADREHDKWTRYQTALPFAEELDDWFSNLLFTPHGLGLVCGAISGGLEVLDLDAKHDPSGTLNARAEAAIRRHAPGLWEKLVIESTPSGGLHLYYRCATPAHNLKLARMPNAAGKLMAVAETRGEGGFIVSSPTPGYTVIQGDLCSPPTINDLVRDALFTAARSLDQSPPESESGPEPSRTRTDFPTDGLRPGDAYNASDAWMDLLKAAGWSTRDHHHWTRPGKAISEGNSANWDTMPGAMGRHFHCYTPNADPLEEGETYSPFRLYAVLKCNGDNSRAARELAEAGFGSPRATPRQPAPTPTADVQSNGVHHPETSEEQMARLTAAHHARVIAESPLAQNAPIPAPKPPLIAARSINSFVVPSDDDPTVLLGNRYLCRGDGLVLASASGMGKSALVIQAAVHWALGRAFMGIKPNGCLRSLIFQSEDSDGDIAEVWASILHEMKLTDEERRLVAERVVIVSDRMNRGLLFMAELMRHVAAATYDLVWVNPLAAFITGDATTQEATAQFLRAGLNGINTPARFGYIIVQHTTKPAADKGKRQWHEIQYDMAGSYDLIGWARAIMSLRPTDTFGEFNLVLAKRGRRAGVTKKVPQGAGWRMESTIIIPMKHSTGKYTLPHIKRELDVIFWEAREETEPNPADKPSGRPKKNDASFFLSIFPVGRANACGVNELLRSALKLRHIAKGTLYSVISEALEKGIVSCDSTNEKAPVYFRNAPVSYAGQ